MRLRLWAPIAAPLFVLGCTPSGDGPNPIDEVLVPELQAAGYEPLEASAQELCTRLFVDLTGARPTAEEFRKTCDGRTGAEMIDSLQRGARYRDTARRRWADRFQYNDFMTDVGSIKGLDALVDSLYREEIGYADFAVQAISHPAFVGRHIGYGQPDLAANAAYEAFLGRSATRPEQLDLGQLWKPWMGTGFIEDGFASDAAFYGYGYEPYVDPFICEAGVRSCESALLGDARIEFPRNGRETWIAASQLTEEDWEALRVPGRLFVKQPMFWEAQVDEVLVRYLGYDLGSIRPDLRQHLVKWFKTTGGNVRRLERAVLNSVAYKQSALQEPERPAAVKYLPYAYGPTKLMISEAWLHSLAKLTGDNIGDCDWRYPNLPDWYYPGDPALDAALEDRYPRREDGTIDPWFRNVAATMGGCPGGFDWATFQVRQRSTHMGMMVAVAQEEALIQACFLNDAKGLLPEGVAPTDTSVDAMERTVRHLLGNAYANPSDDEVNEYVHGRKEGCRSCTAEAVARDVCAAIAGGVEYVFY